jgi:DNA-binding CsgD family transcriptional regulator
MHTSLRAMVDWSWELCTDAEQTLWTRCSMFAEGAGWDLAAATHVCADWTSDHSIEHRRQELRTHPLHHDEATQSTIDGHEVLDLLESLVDKQIVVADTTGTRTRYRMLETLRLYGQDVIHRDERTDLRVRHGFYYCNRIKLAARAWFSPEETDWLAWAETNLANLRATYESALNIPGREIEGLEFATNMARLRTWFFTGSPREGITWLDRALSIVTSAYTTPTDTQVDQIIHAHAITGWIALWQGQTADTHHAVCRALLGQRPAPPMVTHLEGSILLLSHNDARSIDVLATVGAQFTAAGPDFRGDRHMAELTEAIACAFHGTHDQALNATRRCLDNAVAAGAPAAISWARLVRGMALIWHGDPDDALTLLRRTLTWGRANDDRWGTVWALHAIAWALAHQLTTTSANMADATVTATTIAYLLGAADSSRHRTGITLEGVAPFAHATTTAESTARTVVNTAAYTTAYRRGIDAAPAAIIAAALDEPHDPDHAPESRELGLWDTLTPAEHEVARLAAKGLSNQAIATQRHVTRRTVETQITAVLRRLGITNRHEIADMIPD